MLGTTGGEARFRDENAAKRSGFLPPVARESANGAALQPGAFYRKEHTVICNRVCLRCIAISLKRQTNKKPNQQAPLLQKTFVLGN